VPLTWRYLGIAIFALFSYLVSAWALNDDLQVYEWLTIVPFPTLFATATALFYFLLPEGWSSRLILMGVFGIGVYALYLTSNILSVAKGRTIQLLYAAHAVGLFFTMFTSLLLTNTIFSLRLPFYWNAALIGLSHFMLVMMSLWSVNLEPKVNKEVFSLSAFFTLVLAEFALVFSFLPMQVWHVSLFMMSLVYVGLSLFQNLLRGRLFKNTIREYTLVGILMLILFVLMFPGK